MKLSDCRLIMCSDNGQAGDNGQGGAPGGTGQGKPPTDD